MCSPSRTSRLDGNWQRSYGSAPASCRCATLRDRSVPPCDKRIPGQVGQVLRPYLLRGLRGRRPDALASASALGYCAQVAHQVAEVYFERVGRDRMPRPNLRQPTSSARVRSDPTPEPDVLLAVRRTMSRPHQAVLDQPGAVPAFRAHSPRLVRHHNTAWYRSWYRLLRPKLLGRSAGGDGPTFLRVTPKHAPQVLRTRDPLPAGDG